MRRRSARVVIGLLVLISLAFPTWGGVAGAAAATYTGGVSDVPLFVLNDHTTFGVRYSATAGLQPNTTYYVKVRFTVDEAPSPTTNRGWTWNGTSGKWVQEHSAWTEFPPVITDDAGQIPETWVFAKFGDEDTTGTYHLMVSLGTGSGTFNASYLPLVSVIDAKTSGGWVHNATAIGASAKRSEVTSDTSSSVVYSVTKTEPNLIDDDANGVIDDEDCGPAGVSGDTRIGVTADTRFDVAVNRVYAPPYSDDFTLTTPDTDVALNAGDTTPPTKPAALTTDGTPTAIELAWDPASDSGGSGIAGYNVYRWTASPSDLYTQPHLKVATVTSGSAYVDEDVLAGVSYSYEVRAVDASGNVGPRSDTATGILSGLGETTRTAGSDRYGTALAISAATFPASSVTTVVVATGRDFPDALAASGLAGAFASPVLLVGTTVTDSLVAELDRLGATDVVLVGGEAAIPMAVETALMADFNVIRLAGANRYETAAEVAYMIDESVGTLGPAFFVRGDQFADALAVAPFAWSQAMPVLLVQPTAVPIATQGVIDDLGLTDGIVAGGTGAVSDATYLALDGLLGSMTRLSGSDRYATARDVADWAVGEGIGTYQYVGIATGTGFADALGGGAAAGAHGGVLLLTDPTTLSATVADALTANVASIDLVEIYGGPGAVSPGVETAIAQALQ